MSNPQQPMRALALAKGMAFVVLALHATAQAQDNPPAAPAAAPAEASAQSEVQKWIATTDAQWQAAFKRDVTDVHLTELEKLKQQYVASLEAAVTKASAAGDLDGSVALRNEEKRFAGTNLLPEQDEATDAATVKKIREAARLQIAKLGKDTAARTKTLHSKYDQFLADAQAQLTKAQRFEDALLVKAKREEVTAAWLAGTNAVAAQIRRHRPPVLIPPRVVPGKPIASVESQPTSLNSQLCNTKWQLGVGKTFTLHPDGTSTSSWTPRKGSWKVTGPDTVDLSVYNVKTHVKGTLNPERTVITTTSGKSDEKSEMATLIKP